MLATLLIAACFWATAAARAASEPPTTTREIYVPSSDLKVLLQSEPHRVLLTRHEYDDLVKKAKKTPELHVPHASVTVSSDYDITVEDGRARIHGAIAIDVLEDGMQAVPLDFGGVGLLAARLDDQPAPIGYAADGRLNLLVPGKGRRQLVLDLVAPLEMTSAQQSLSFRLTNASVGRWRLSVPGDVEIKSGADVVSRKVDVAGPNAEKGANVTRFELLPRTGNTTIQMSLNSHLQRREPAVASRCVLFDEVTEAYEKLHASVTCWILHRAVDRFRFVVPEGFEITEINSPLLARWDVETDSGRMIASVRLREQTTDTVVLSIAAIKSPVQLKAWHTPRLKLLDVISQVTVLGVLVQDDLKAESLAAGNLIPVDAGRLATALPPELVRIEPGAVPLRYIAAYYAPQGEYELKADFRRAPATLAATTSLLLNIQDKNCEVLGGFALLPTAEKRFGFDFSVPAGWSVIEVTGPNNSPLAIERDTSEKSPGRVHVKLPQGVVPGQIYAVSFRAHYTPPAWLSQWQSQSLEFPMFRVAAAQRDEGAVAVMADEDMDVKADKAERLVPITTAEMARFGLAAGATRLAFRYENSSARATIAIDRKQPRATARTFAFFQILPGLIRAHYIVIYTIEDAKTRRLALLLPASTPKSLAISGLEGVTVKEFTPEDAGTMRRWNVLLDEARRGEVRLAVDFEMRPQTVGESSPRHGKPANEKQESAPLTADAAGNAGELKDFALPLLTADTVVYQSGLVAIEGDLELGVDVNKTTARRADVGQLAIAKYTPACLDPNARQPVNRGQKLSPMRLLGIYEFVGPPPKVSVDVYRNPSYALTPVIVERADLTTLLSADGTSQTQATFHLRTKAPYIEIELPERASLWSAVLDDTPLKPQKRGVIRLIGMPPGTTGGARSLQLVYEAPVQSLTSGSHLKLVVPRLLYRASREANRTTEIPLVNFGWTVTMPDGYEAVAADGTLEARAIVRPVPAPLAVLEAIYNLGGGYHPHWLSFAREHARSAGAKNALHGIGMPLQGNVSPPADGSFTRQRGNMLGLNATTTPPAPTTAASPEPELPAILAKPGPGVNGPGPGRVDLNSAAAKPAYQQQNLLGFRSLQIEVQQSDIDKRQMLTFDSLGANPQISITLARRNRNTLLVWGLALAVFLLGVALTTRPVRQKVAFVFGLALLSSLLPLAWDTVSFARICNGVFYAASLLVPYFLAAGALRGIIHWLRRLVGRFIGQTPASVTVALVLTLVLLTSATAQAQPQPVMPEPPVPVPGDAIIVPYDVKSKTGVQDADHLLVSYDRYIELWNRAYPDKKIDAHPAPLPYALSGATYSAVLKGDETLNLTGQMQINLPAEGYVSIPLGLRGGVLARADLDGKPARLKVVGAATEPPSPSKGGKAPAAMDATLLVLQVSGKGTHKLEMEIRLKLAHVGGWRGTMGSLPTAPAVTVTIRVPEPHTEVRLGQAIDRRARETQRPDETLETALGPGGALQLQWRPIVAEGQVDRGLTVQTAGLLDVQEDGLRMALDIKLEFRRSQRDAFSLALPADYLVEKVAGSNVRGWDIRRAASEQTIEVSLLKTAKDTEQFKMFLSRSGKVGQVSLDTFAVPMVTVRDAALSSGQLTIRRSPLLDLRTAERSGVTRIDLGPLPDLTGRPAAEESVLALRPYEAYRFPTTPFVLRLSAAPVIADVTAVAQTSVKLDPTDPGLESKIVFHVGQRPIYRFEIAVPEGLRLPEVTLPSPGIWSIEKAGPQTVQDGPRNVPSPRSILRIQLQQGVLGDAAVILRGKLPALDVQREISEVSLPRLEVLGVKRQEGQIAVQAAPAFNVQARDLRDCQETELVRVAAWLDPQFRAATRLALQYAADGYAGKLRLTPRTPDVVCDTVTNVRITDRAIEETIILNYSIHNADVRELTFLLPASMAGARIFTPMLRQKTVVPVDPKVVGSPVRVHLELQGDTMNDLRVLIQNDRMLTPGSPAAPHAVPLPAFENAAGREADFVRRQYVVLETASRDELVELPVGMQAIGRQQELWRTLSELLGNNGSYKAYLVQSGAAKPQLGFYLKRYEDVETAGARIDLAQTTIVVDASGAYRAKVELSLDNSSEQFLDVELPDGATLWTVHVAGEPVKPAQVPGATDARHVLLPLQKTAKGDLNYRVVLKYGGNVPSLSFLSSVEFPLVRNAKPYPSPAGGTIGIERSQVEVYVPKSHQWFDFGGTVYPAKDEAELKAGRLAAFNKQGQRLIDATRDKDRYVQERAKRNLNVWIAEANRTRSEGGRVSSQALQSQFLANSSVTELANDTLKSAGKEQADETAAGVDNRERLNDFYYKQDNVSGVALSIGNNTYSGGTTVGAGTLSLTNPNLANGRIILNYDQQFGGQGNLGNANSPGNPAGFGAGLGGPGGQPQAMAQPRMSNSGPAAQQSYARRSGLRDEQRRELAEYQQKLALANNLDQPAAQSGQQQPAVRESEQKKPVDDSDELSSTVSERRKLEKSRNEPAAQSGKNELTATPAALDTSASIAATAPAGLASLDFELPTDANLYELFRFTTPRGDAELTARNVSNSALVKLEMLAGILAASLLAWAVLRLVRRGALNWFRRPLGAILLVLAGLASLSSGLLPFAGLIAVLVGIGLLLAYLCGRWCRRPAHA